MDSSRNYLIFIPFPPTSTMPDALTSNDLTCGLNELIEDPFPIAPRGNQARLFKDSKMMRRSWLR